MSTARQYTDDEIERIGRLVAEDKEATDRALKDAIWMADRYHRDDWDSELFVAVDLYEDWLRSVQQEKTSKITGRVWTEDTKFEDYLNDCLITLRWRIDEIRNESSLNVLDYNIDVRTYQAAKDITERAMEAIKKFLEKPAHLRLIGV